MGRIKTFRTYLIILIAFWLFSVAITYIGFNATYRDMYCLESMPAGTMVEVEFAQSTSVNGRIYGTVTSTEENDLNGKYIKVQIYSKNNNLLGTKFLQIYDTVANEPKRFKVNFTAEYVKYYTIEILDNSEDVKEEAEQAEKLWDGIFTSEEAKGATILALIIALAFGF